MGMSEAARKARNEYMRKWRSKPENKLKEQQYKKEWESRPENKGKRKIYQNRYWERKAKEMEQAREG